MDPNDPADAQQVVIEYARVLEADYAEQRHPSRVDGLPFAKPIIKAAIRTSVVELVRSGQLTDELRDYFEIDSRYVALAALQQLARQGNFDRKRLPAALKTLQINPDKVDPKWPPKGETLQEE